MRKVLFALLLSFSLDARLVFIHIPKTGGTTLRCLLEMQVSATEIYPVRNLKGVNLPIAHDLVSGHLPYWFCRRNPEFEKSFKVTILREPIERYLSFLRAKKKEDPSHPSLESVMDKKFVPHHPYQFGLLDNAMCRFLAAHPHLKGEMLLKSAIEGLEKFDAVLFFETFEQDVLDLFSRLGVPLGEIPKMNVTEKGAASEELLERIRQENLWDLKLYEYAKQHIRNKETRYELRGPSFKGLLKRTDSVDYTFDLPMNGKGWSYRFSSEDIPYRWVTDKPATIYFSLETEKDYEFSFIAHPFREEVTVEAYVNGQKIELHETRDTHFSLYRGTIPREWIDEEPTEISFRSKHSFPYDEIPHQHLRVSFAVQRIQIHP